MRFFPAFAILVMSAPLAAKDSAAIPEPSNMALFGLGLLGLVVGRQFAKSRIDRDEPPSGD